VVPVAAQGQIEGDEMFRRPVLSFLRDEAAAVAPTVALSLFGLVAAGGLAFDYARLASLDTELQNAADQAALSAASQLDGEAGACSRSAGAARALITNKTRFASDAGGANVTIPNESGCDAAGSVRFYQDSAKTQAATTDANAKFVQITVTPRQAYYTLTPVVQLFQSGAMSATAFAGLAGAVCKVPPVMICNPFETGGNLNFDVAATIGKGIRLVSTGAGGGWAPGNFGYLDNSDGTNGANGLRQALGWDTQGGLCLQQTGVSTKPGANTTVTDALNTRFDIFDGNNSCPSGGTCSASRNSAKDLIKTDGTNANDCALGSHGWQESSRPYLPTSAAALTATQLLAANRPLAMGHPRDMCHAADPMTCGNVGDGAWDRNAYFTVNYPALNWQAAMTAAYGTTSVTRYQVYQWEIANAATTIDVPRTAEGTGGNTKYAYQAPYCASSVITPSTASGDRRKLSAAVVNCTASGVNGSSTGVPVVMWIDLFLVEPSVNRTRTNAADVYVEVISGTNTAGGGPGEFFTPYLIE
jgi:Putative Flp pilus-assembly TadE/G-like